MTYTPLGISELNALELPPVEYVIDGIIPAGALILLHAREKSGKSLMAIDMMVSIATGETFLDRAVTQGPAAIVTLEDNLRDVRSRVNTRLAGLRGVPFYVLPADGSLPDVRFSLQDPVSVLALREMIVEYELRAVAIDNLRESHQLPENDSDAMSPLLRSVRQVAHETNCAVVLTHHERKTGNGEPRGSTAIAAAFDQVIGWQLSSPDAEELAGALRVKGRYGPRQTLHARFGANGRWEMGTIVHIATNTRERIAAWLESAGGWHSAKAIHTGMSDTSIALRTVQNELPALVREETVLERGTGKKSDPKEYAFAGTSRLFPDVPGEPSGTEKNDSPRPEPLGNTSGGINERICPRCEGPMEAGRKFVCVACQQAAEEDAA